MKRVLLVAVLGVMAAALAALAFDGPDPAATVAGQHISVEELQQRVAPLTRTTSFKEQIGQGEDPGELRRDLVQRVLTQLIREEILTRAAQDLDVSVTSAQVDTYIESIKRDREIRSDATLRRVVQAAGFTMDEWRRIVRFTVLERALQRRVVERAEPTEAEARAYYRSHLERYSTAHVQHILVREERVARRIVRQLEGAPRARVGAMFARLARRFSLDDSTKDKGGDLGFVQRGSYRIVLPQLESAINEMEPGEISGPVTTKLGLHIVRLVSRKPTPFAEVREEIETKLLEPPDPYRAYLEDAYASVEVSPSYGELDANFRVVDVSRSDRDS